jgi:hypothetical protein
MEMWKTSPAADQSSVMRVMPVLVIYMSGSAKRGSVFRRIKGAGPMVIGGNPSRTTGAEEARICFSATIGSGLVLAYIV